MEPSLPREPISQGSRSEPLTNVGRENLHILSLYILIPLFVKLSEERKGKGNELVGFVGFPCYL
jgi:hypothetical protein